MKYFVSLTHRPEVILKLVSATTSGTECCVQAGEVFVVTHLDEPGHGLRWETNEVQVPCSATHCQIPQLQVDITDTSFTLVEEEQMLFFQNSKYIFAQILTASTKKVNAIDFGGAFRISDPPKMNNHQTKVHQNFNTKRLYWVRTGKHILYE